MEAKFYWLIWIVLGVALFIVSLSSQQYFYHMKETNCESIMHTFDASTEDVADCKRFQNYPFWNFTFDYWIIFGFLHLTLGGLVIIIAMIVDDLP